MKRPLCIINGCNNLRRKNGISNRTGLQKFRTLCAKHSKLKCGVNPNVGAVERRLKKLGDITKRPCVECGWNESYCDRHRLISGENGGKYVKGNVVPLCPNCHRVLHETTKTGLYFYTNGFKGK